MSSASAQSSPGWIGWSTVAVGILALLVFGVWLVAVAG